MPSHDETSPVAPRAGSVRRPLPARTRSTGGGGGRGSGRPPAGGRVRTTASRTGNGTPQRPGGSRAAGARPAAKKGKPAGSKGTQTKKQKRNRRLTVAGGLIAGMLVLLGVFVGVVYASTEVPSPDSITTSQTTVIYYSDGVTEMARLGDENRTNVALDQIAEPAQNAVLAAENRSFYSDPGISLTGIIRAAWNNLTGGSTQGGSTITQQYVKNAILQNSEQTFSRKFQELFLSIKLDNNYTKQQILENYLNTIYYGRGAYGIEAAANTYFGVPAAQLTAQQGAVLAVLIRSPSRYDPEVSPEDAQDRWGRVLDAMVEEGWLTAEERAASEYPPVLPKAGSSLGLPGGPEGHIVGQVLDEVGTKYGYDEEQVRAGGLRITTTVNKGMQDAAAAAVQDAMGDEDPEMREALVSIDPRTGGVVAYYGNEFSRNEDPAVDTTDYVQALKPPGSSFKPYTLAAALDQGIGIGARRDGRSPQEFPDRPGQPVVNAGNAQCGACTLEEAITRSLNTTFYGLAYEVGPERVAEVARAAAGIPATWDAADPTVPAGLEGFESLSIPGTDTTGGSIGIGEYAVRPIQQASGFATFAAGGIYRPPHFVASVADNTGTVLMTVDPASDAVQAIAAEVANDVSVALADVADSSDRALAGDRPVASKTGTQGLNREDNSDAWMVGYTPSISTAVWVGTQGAAAIEDTRGRIVYGSGLPGEIWQQFMNTVLEGTPEEALPTEPIIEGDTGEGVPEPEPEPERTREAPAPTRTPTPTPTAPSTTSAAPSPPPTPTPTCGEAPLPPCEEEVDPGTGGGTPALPGQPGDPGRPADPGGAGG